MAGANDDQQDEPAEAETGRSVSITVRDPYILFIALIRKCLHGVSWLHERYSWLPRWARVGGGLVIFLAGIYFNKQIQQGLNFIASATIGRFFGEVVQFSFGTQLILFLMVILSIQAAIINYRLFVIENELVDGGMEIEFRLRPDGGYPEDQEAPDDAEQATTSGSGALAGAATGAVLGSGFGPGGAIGGAILGAIVGDEIEKSSIRRKRHREHVRVGGYEIETYTIDTDPEGRISPDQISKQVVSVVNHHREKVAYFHFDLWSEAGDILIFTKERQWIAEATIQNLLVQDESQVEFEIQQPNYRPTYDFDNLVIDIWVTDQLVEEFPSRTRMEYQNATNLVTLRPKIPLTFG